MISRLYSISHQFIFILFLLFLSSCDSFTKTDRVLEIIIENRVYPWDPVLVPFQRFVNIICEDLEYLCLNNSRSNLENRLINDFSDILDEKRFQYYKSFDDYLLNFSTYHWLGNSLGSNQYHVVELFKETTKASKGFLIPRSYCNNPVNFQSNRCSYFQILLSNNLIGFDLNVLITSNSIENNLDSLYLLMVEIFNKNINEVSEGLGIFILRNLLPSWRKNNKLSPLQVFKYHYIKFNICKLLSEIQRIRGNIQTSILLTHSYIFSFFALNQLAPSDYQYNRIYLYYLKLITITPTMPPPYDISEYNRHEILGDLSLFLQLIKQDQITLDFSNHNDLIEDLAATPFYLAHEGLNDRDFQVLYYQILSTLCPMLNYISPHLKLSPSEQRNNDSNRIYKIGFLSTHFYDHSIGKILLQLLIYSQLSIISDDKSMKDISKEIFVYFIDEKFSNYDELLQSQWYHSLENDPIYLNLKEKLGSRFIHLPNQVDIVREKISHDELDILVFADIGMDIVSYLLAFSRFAKIQATWWGHPISTGMDSMDYFFGLDNELINANEQYSEQLIRMDFINTIPLSQADISTDRSAISSSFNNINLPDTSRIAIIIGRLFKVHPEFESLLAKILINIENSQDANKDDCLLVIIIESVLEFNQIFYLRLREMISAYILNEGLKLNVDKVLSRLFFAPYNNYMETLQLSKVVLDTFPYGGCITSHDALHMSIPLVTLPSDYIRGRFTIGLYLQMNHTDLICSNDDCYINSVVRLLLDDEYNELQRQAIWLGYKDKLHKNIEVTKEWLSFMIDSINMLQ